jgi:hypothetical protein
VSEQYRPGSLLRNLWREHSTSTLTLRRHHMVTKLSWARTKATSHFAARVIAMEQRRPVPLYARVSELDKPSWAYPASSPIQCPRLRKAYITEEKETTLQRGEECASFTPVQLNDWLSAWPVFFREIFCFAFSTESGSRALTQHSFRCCMRSRLV